MGALGYALIGIGIAIILIALVLGYGIYANAHDSLGSLALPAGHGFGATNSSINGSVSSLTGSLKETALAGTYTIIEIIALFLIASIGYKLAYLGIQANGNSRRTKQQV
ncbi:MAG: hypothetical protein QXF01_00920 [Candidatus Micrarchaeaceae archaeon]